MSDILQSLEKNLLAYYYFEVSGFIYYMSYFNVPIISDNCKYVSIL